MPSASQLFDWGRWAYGVLASQQPQARLFSPLRFFLEPTYRCNCRCPFCYVGEHRADGELSTSQWLGVIQQIPRWAFISFEGGECTLRSDFLVLLAAARRRVLGKVNVLTNGTVLNPVQLGRLVDEAPLVLSVSLDGLEDTHNRLRGEKRFAQVWDTLERVAFLRRQKLLPLPWLDVKLVLLPENVGEVAALYEACAKLGVEYFSISLRNDTNLKQNSRLRPALSPEFTSGCYPRAAYDLEAVQAMMIQLHGLRQRYPLALRWAPKFMGYAPSQAEVRACRQQGLPESWCGSASHREWLQLKSFLTNPAPPACLYRPCTLPFSSLFINPQGDVYPCLSVRWGNVQDMALCDIWNGEAARNFRRALQVRGVFPACQMCCEAVPQ